MKKTFFYFPLMMFASCSAKQEKPNVIVILADDLGVGDVSAYGAKTIATPNIDKLANNGVAFTRGYATSATSTPSRYGMMTGYYPWRNKDAKILPGDAPLLIKDTQFTLPKMMQKAGYTTGAIGKWHLGMGDGNVNWNEKITPGANEIGFDYSCLIAATNDRVPTVYVENGEVVGLDKNDPIEVSYVHNFDNQPTGLDNPELLTMNWHHGHNNTIVNGVPRIGFMKGGEKSKWVDEEMADYFVDKVKAFISDNKKEPFFLYYGLHQPHVPRCPNPRFVGTSGMGPRGDVIVEADWCVGQLIETLEENNLLDNTLIIFSSDNGPVLNDGYYDQAVELLGDHQPSGGFRGGKYSLFEGGTRVPFLVYWKNRIKPLKSKAMVCHLDIMASLASLLDFKLEEPVDSENHLAAFMGVSEIGRENLIIEAQGKLAYRKGDFVMIPAYNGPQRNITNNELGNLPEAHLFNLNDDIKQEVNVKEAYPELFKEMNDEFIAYTNGYYKKNVKEEALK